MVNIDANIESAITVSFSVRAAGQTGAKQGSITRGHGGGGKQDVMAQTP
jgi:hypothetical protein